MINFSASGHGKNTKNTVQINNGNYVKEARKTAFWTSLIVGILSSLIASFLYNHCFEKCDSCSKNQIECNTNTGSNNPQ